MGKKPKYELKEDKLRELVEEFDYAAHDHAWLSSNQPGDQAAVQKKYDEAKKALSEFALSLIK